MSYPYGDEYYPTFEQLENEYRLDELKHAFYYELHRQAKETREEFEKTRRFFNVNSTEGNDYNGVIESGCYPDEPTAEHYGVAFARALEYAFDGDEEMSRFFQDLFAILEDKVVSAGDKEQAKWAEDSCRIEQMHAIKELLKNKPESELTAEHRKSYEEDVAKYESERIAFAISQVKAIEEKMNANAKEHGGIEIKLNIEVFGKDSDE